MSGRSARRRWLAALVPVVLLVAVLAVGFGGVASSATSASSVTTLPLTLHLGQPGQPDGFHFDGQVQGLTATDCEVSLSGPVLAVLTAGKPSDPQGAVVGRFEHLLGAKGVSENVGATGRPCGEVDDTETLRLAVGPGLSNKHATSGLLNLVRRPGPNLTVGIRFFDAAGGLLGQTTAQTTGVSTAVPVDLGAPFAAVEVTSLTDNRGISLANGTTLHLADAYSESLECGQGDDFEGSGAAVKVEVSDGEAKGGSPQECVVNFNLVIDQAPDGRSVLFDPADSGFDVTFTVTIAWDPEPAEYPVPGTRFSVDDVPGPGEFPEFCDEGEPPAGSSWCILEQKATSEGQDPGEMQVTETYIGKGDPNWLR
jgi:hypothetical protein